MSARTMDASSAEWSERPQRARRRSSTWLASVAAVAVATLVIAPAADAKLELLAKDRDQREVSIDAVADDLKRFKLVIRADHGFWGHLSTECANDHVIEIAENPLLHGRRVVVRWPLPRNAHCEFSAGASKNRAGGGPIVMRLYGRT
jgi:hypothetical protein